MRILIAEDDAPLAGFVRKGLEAERYAVDVSADGEQARALATELDNDLIVLDLNLLRLDGVGILKSVRVGAELHFNGLCTATLENCKRALEKELAQLEKLRDQQYEVFRQARMQREIVESIRDSQLREYQIKKDRREQRSLDDQFLSRREFLRREPQ